MINRYCSWTDVTSRYRNDSEDVSPVSSHSDLLIEEIGGMVYATYSLPVFEDRGKISYMHIVNDGLC